jgi:hypothetical protein
MLLIDDGVIVSLDFSGSIYQKNVGATFYRDKFDFGKTTLLFINCFFIFLYFLDWSLVDKISIDIKNFIVEYFYFFNRLLWSLNNENSNLNNRENNILQLSNSNISIISSNSNEESNNNDEDINSNSSNNNLSVNRINDSQINIFEDVFERMPCI